MGESGDEFRIEVHVSDQMIVVRVAGEIDIANVDEFRSVLWMLPVHPATLRVDLSRVTLLSAAGVRALVGVHLRRRARAGQLVLCNPNSTVRRVLRATRVNRVIPIIGGNAASLDSTVRRPWPAAVPVPPSPRTAAERWWEPACVGRPAS
ncbi:STAS domain-containing protein [Micromonospora polyrhachis]|uniref:Anti-sigma factor antagonist n=1 Tax=Micromonospora polyrhachis TaxID=1282883 RepID=A0A7W7SWG0_9ACTN|nr:STAS domain-containing protein [Micromonospora polyrhachis]MBB4962245.1 anti-anti-sigma factor [Micromonospora polyrhachis]